MGRWAQRRIAGGGPSPTAALIEMTAATVTDPDKIQVDYSGDVTAGAFGANDFETQPGTVLGTSISQVASNAIEITFADTINAEATLTYSGGNSGILTPQTVPIG